MDFVTFTANKINPKLPQNKRSKIQMTPRMVQEELNRIYAVRARAKQCAIAEAQKKRRMVKIRQIKRQIVDYFSKFLKTIK